ncbi:MAG: hypothetical protein QOK15_3633 [Nocardioidaceae bacterium]|jgi:hypothetical protein|nr:hypothetical protein [Nocardioidaceae bacterium]
MFGRSKSSSPSELEQAAAELKASGKGRPTPTRKEAEAARKQRLAAPRGRKEENAAKRAQTKAYRERQRTALLTGDDTYLPTRDKGPAKRYVRDFVDSRWCIGEILLPLFFLVFAVVILGQSAGYWPSIAWMVILVLMAADAVRLARGAKAGVRSRFGDDETKGIAMYAVMRGWQMRRLRLPKPQVKHGDHV